MRLARWKTAIGIGFLVAVLSVPVYADTDKHSATPGTVNYIEGQVSVGNQSLDSKAVGSVGLQAGESLATQSGKAEILLTPGVYVRLGSNSSIKMISSNLTDTQLALNQGEAMVEVDEIHPQNNIRISQPGGDTRVLKTGLYSFDASNNNMMVFDGRASVEANDREVTVKGGHELALNTDGKLKAQGFDKKRVEQSDDLYRWSSLRSEYLSQANTETARAYVANGWYGPGWFGPGWYWNPWSGGFTFLPADGFLFSPFGWGFYSPLVIYKVPIPARSVPHHFDGSRPAPAIGSGFHDHAVRAFNGPPPMARMHSAPLPPPPPIHR